MKFRIDFVTNSSSSHFIIFDSKNWDELGNNDKEELRYAKEAQRLDSGCFSFERKDNGTGFKQGTLYVNRIPGVEVQFHWEERQFADFWDKFAYLALQVHYAQKDTLFDYEGEKAKLLKILNNIAKYKGFEVEDFIVDGSIDHQSADFSIVAEAFESMVNLKTFLFNRSNVVVTDNDNH